jgi:hypothetical protein
MGQTTTSRLVPDPSMSDAEFLAQKAANPTKPNLGRVWVEENALTRIGALAYIRRRFQHHEMAAERFKNLYEARYGVGSPALDPSRVQVDTSPIAHDSGMAAKIDRTVEIERVIRLLGKEAADRIIACVVLCIPCDDGVPVLPSGFTNRRHVKREVDALLAALDSLAVLFGFRTRG